MLVELDRGWQGLKLHGLEDPGEDGSVALEVPVLIDDLVDHSCLEDLVRLVSEEVNQVVHVVDGLGVLHVLTAPLRQYLLAEGGHEVLEIGVAGQLDGLARVLNAHFDLVADGREQRQDERLPLPEGS